ncbi:MAG: hydroxymethylpyrimidine/phosphomethylpyrimidine kinase [Solirubrobacteraceae bacterium]
MSDRASRTPRALTIAGSDSGGGAGIQADLKAFARCGVHGTSAITAITAQNTLGVSVVYPIPVEVILAQVQAVVADIGVDVVKVGMLATTEIVHAVAQALDELPEGTPVVVDPVMVAESGAELLDAQAQSALLDEILPRATVLTPNVPEARALAGLRFGEGVRDGLREDDRAGRGAGGAGLGGDADRDGGADLKGAGRDAGAAREGWALGDGEDEAEIETLARAVLALGVGIVVLTGGHRTHAVDIFLDSADPEQVVNIPGKRHLDGASHGSGCTHSSILAAQLALGRAPLQAAFAARAIAGAAVADGLRDVGEGPGPVDVMGLARLRLG